MVLAAIGLALVLLSSLFSKFDKKIDKDPKVPACPPHDWQWVEGIGHVCHKPGCGFRANYQGRD